MRYFTEVCITSSHTLDMLQHSRTLLEQRLEKKGRRRIHFPHVNWTKWVASGNEEMENIPPADRPEYQADIRSEKSKFPSDKDSIVNNETRRQAFYRTTRKSWWYRKRALLADLLDWITGSDHVLYALKFTLGVMLVTWPSFNIEWIQWFVYFRGGKVNS